MGLKQQMNNAARRPVPEQMKKGNVFKATANKLQVKKDTPKHDVLNAIASRHQTAKPATQKTVKRRNALGM